MNAALVVAASVLLAASLMSPALAQGSGAVRLTINPEAPTVARTELSISAPPASVWEVLTDIGHWPDWMPEIASARLEGPLAPGSVIHWEPQGQIVESRLVEVIPERRLVWNGTDGAVHVWELIPAGSGTLLRNEESIDSWKVAKESKEGSQILTQGLAMWNQRLAEQATKRANARAAPGQK
jgi:uncharacterized protein YndB with AHSA1/START domain